MNTPLYRRTKETQPIQNPYNFQPAAPFGGEKKGERERCVKGLPAQGRAGISEKQAYPCKKNPCAPLTQRESSPKLRTPKGAAEKLRRCILYCCVFIGYRRGTIWIRFSFSFFQGLYISAYNSISCITFWLRSGSILFLS